MGTNYYAIPKADEETKLKIKDAIDRDQYFAAKELIPCKVHIGKSAGGWSFLFNSNDWRYFENTEASIQAFLSNCQIRNEYGDIINPNDFWVMVENKKNLKPELTYGFMADGLNFSKYTEFS